MEAALKQVTEELTHSRADYSALFQNFKQSRILFEERELASKAHAQRLQNENRALEGALKQMTSELNLCRSDYSVLLQNSERAGILSEEREEVSRASLVLITQQCEAAQLKVQEQKSIMKTQRATERGFRDDLYKLEQVTAIFEMREKSLVEKCDSASVLNGNLKEEIRQISKLAAKQSADIEMLNSIIENEMVNKYDYDCIVTESEEMRRRIESDMISLNIHQNLKEKYAELKSRVEGSMVTVDEYGAVASKLEVLRTKVKDEYVARVDHIHLQERYQKIFDEKITLIEDIDVLQTTNKSIIRDLSETEEKIIDLKERLDDAEREVLAAQAREELRIEIAAIDEERQQYLDRDLTAQREINTLRNERHATELMEGSFKSMEDECVKANLKAEEDIRVLGELHAFELIRLRESHHTALEASELLIQQIRAQHAEQIDILTAERREGREATEEAHKSQWTALNTIHQSTIESLTLRHTTEIEEIRQKFITDHDLDMSRAFRELREVYSEEINSLKVQLLRAEEALKIEGHRAESSISELFRIESEYKGALNRVERAYNEEMTKGEHVSADNHRSHAQISTHQDVLHSMVLEKEMITLENERLREVAMNFEDDSRHLRGQLEGVKDAMLESMTETLSRSNPHYSPFPQNTSSSRRRNSDRHSDSNTEHSNQHSDVTHTYSDHRPIRKSSTSSSSKVRSSSSSSAQGTMSKSTSRSAQTPRNNLIDDYKMEMKHPKMTPIQAAIYRKNALAASTSSSISTSKKQVEQQQFKQRRQSSVLDSASNRKAIEEKKKNENSVTPHGSYSIPNTNIPNTNISASITSITMIPQQPVGTQNSYRNNEAARYEEKSEDRNGERFEGRNEERRDGVEKRYQSVEYGAVSGGFSSSTYPTHPTYPSIPSASQSPLQSPTGASRSAVPLYSAISPVSITRPPISIPTPIPIPTSYTSISIPTSNHTPYTAFSPKAIPSMPATPIIPPTSSILPPVPAETTTTVDASPRQSPKLIPSLVPLISPISPLAPSSSLELMDRLINMARERSPKGPGKTPY